MSFFQGEEAIAIIKVPDELYDLYVNSEKVDNLGTLVPIDNKSVIQKIPHLLSLRPNLPSIQMMEGKRSSMSTSLRPTDSLFFSMRTKESLRPGFLPNIKELACLTMVC